jgi:Flp pilus assembly protein CpaB
MKLVHVPIGTVVPTAVARPTDLAGRVAVAPVYRGEQITLRRFAGLQQQGIVGDLSGRLRALQIAGDADQVLAGTLRNGDHVDVVASLKTPTGQQPYGRTVLRNALVLRAPSGSSSQGGAASSYSATLRVTDAQAQTLFFVIKNGDWSFVLRPMVHATNGSDLVDSVQSVLRGGR